MLIKKPQKTKYKIKLLTLNLPKRHNKEKVIILENMLAGNYARGHNCTLSMELTGFTGSRPPA